MKMKRKKDSYFQIRVLPREKREMQEQARDEGLQNLTAYVLWLHRQHKKNILRKSALPLDKAESEM